MWLLLVGIALFWPLGSLFVAVWFDSSTVRQSTPPTHYIEAVTNKEAVSNSRMAAIRAAAQVALYLQQETKQLLSSDVALAASLQKSLPLMAYLEQPLPTLDPNSTEIPRLPSRRFNRPENLTRIVYQIAKCASIPNAFPVMVPPTALEELEYHQRRPDAKCPVLQDPFLPWIHDVFVGSSSSGNAELVLHVVAHNQRRCHTDPKVYHDRLARLEPQVTLMQSVPMKRVKGMDSSNRTLKIQYQLTSLEDANAKETRFICQFHAQLLRLSENSTNPTYQKVVAGETLSRFVYNYEHANYQKGKSPAMLTRPRMVLEKDGTLSTKDDKTALHNENVWNSILQFECPLPDHLQPLLSITSALNLYVDIVPVRTYPRLDRAGYFDRTFRNMTSDDVTFDPAEAWGNDASILPPVEASGRWANIPVCLPPNPTTKKNAASSTKEPQKEARNLALPDYDDHPNATTPHFLVACVWASASFTTRGSSDADTSTSERLLEWLTFQLHLAGFDHVYVYDNSEAHSNTTNLEPVTSLFSPSQVTRIPWKHPVCNNNRPGNRDPGERSSQYTAEASCRARYGPTTKWMAVFDPDEYFIPQEPYTSVRHWLKTKYESDTTTKILSFFQTRALPNTEYMDPVASEDGNDLQAEWKKKANATFLETYNCDKVPFPKPGWSWRAKKQIFQPSYVLHHFVHYSLVTKRLLDFPNEKSGFFKDHAPYEKRVDEQKEAFMVHAKTTSPQATRNWRKLCQGDMKDCPIGITKDGSVYQDVMNSNCFTHDSITAEFAPKLKALLMRRGEAMGMLEET